MPAPRNSDLVSLLSPYFLRAEYNGLGWANAKLQFGATGDGTTDDTTALQNTISALSTLGGGIMYLEPNNTFLISDTLTLDDNIQVVGGGPSSIIKRTDGNPIIAAGSGVSNVRVANLMLEGPGAASAGSNDYGIRIKTSNNVIIERVWAHGWRAGISFYGTTTGDGNVNITIRDCYCYDNLLHGIFCIIDQDRILVENNYCYHNGGYGIVLDDSSSGTAIQAPKLCVVRGNVCRDNTGGGIILEGGRETVVSENQCFNNGTNQYYSQTQVGHGIFLNNAQNDIPCLRNVVSNNICYLNRINGIYIAGGSENIVHDNFLEDNGNGSSAGRGITISDIAGPIVSNRNKVHDNFIRKASAVDMVIGIRIDDTNCSYNEIYNNTIYDTDGTGGWTAISDLGTDTRLGFNEGDDPAALSFTDTDTTPSVIARRKAYRFVNTGATDVTDLDDALELQEVIVFSTNANTTLKDVSTTGNFHLAGSADYNIPAQGWVKLVYWGGAWREISRSAN